MLITQDAETRRYSFAVTRGPVVTLGPGEWQSSERLEVVLTWSIRDGWVFNSAIVTGRHSRTGHRGQVEFVDIVATPEWVENTTRLMIRKAQKEVDDAKSA